jgi:hypothetical protein
MSSIKENFMTKDEALEAALTALKYDPNSYGYKEIADIAIKAIEKALEQPAQECKWCKSREVNFDLDDYPDNAKDA